MNAHDSAFLDIQDLTKIFSGTTRAVDGINFSLGRGELVSILGPSGCGKTTLLKMIGGFIQPSQGRILLDGRPITHLPPHQRDTCMVFQNFALFPHMTVADNVGYGLKIRKLPKAEIRERVADLLEMVRLQGLGNRRPGELSGGQQQRVALARALSLNPKVLLLDEPFSSLDANLRKHMQEEIRQIHQRLGLTIIFVTHDQEEAFSISQRILVMKQGQLCQSGRPDQVYHHPASPFVADFVGNANLLTGQVKALDGQGMTVDTALGRVALQGGQASGFPKGSEITLMVRPEAVEIIPLDGECPGGPNVFRGRVETVRFSGAHLRYQCRIGETCMEVDRTARPGERVMVPGTGVCIRLPLDIHPIETPMAAKAS